MGKTKRWGQPGMKNIVQAYGVGGVGEELKDESLIQ